MNFKENKHKIRNKSENESSCELKVEDGRFKVEG